MNVIREVASFEDLVDNFDKERIVTIWNSVARNRDYRKQYNKSWRTEAREDAKKFRELTAAAKSKGVSLKDLLKSL